MSLRYLVAFIIAASQSSASPIIDGRIDPQEWAGATRASMTGGGEMQLLRSGEFLYLAVRGPKSGLASLCVSKGATVRILHASAAVGEAAFARDGESWTKHKDFEWVLRDSPRTGGASEQAKTDFLASAGWVANASAAGSREREFKIRASDVEAIAVTFLSTDEPMTVSYWPASVDDACRSVEIPRGNLPASARFNVASWHRP
jgi:hypothetical protein